MHKGQLVVFKSEPGREIPEDLRETPLIIVRGPYEAAIKHNTFVTSLTPAVDLLTPSGDIMAKIPTYCLRRVTRDRSI